ncbi:MAG: hypothetical protein QNJ40_23365 [Xanthomonadales bacterium]|nr:hypothetical protein [Xanthomonadales bacterium]
MQAIWIFLLLCALSVAHAQNTEFTYQGELRRAGAPAEGVFDFEVALYVQKSGGRAVDVLVLDDVVVEIGRFVLALDFTAVPFEAGPTWLEIRVRSESEPGYTTLSPRQRVAPVPYAITAQSVGKDSVGALEIDASEVQRRVTGSCPAGSYLAGIGADGQLDCEPLPIGLSIALDAVGPDESSAAIAVRPDGRPVISYYDSTNGHLKLYDCFDGACLTGIARTLDTSGDVGQDSDVVIRNNGTPIVSYYDATNGNFKIYDCADPGCAQGSARTPRPTLASDGRQTSIAIRDDGLPIIAYVGIGSDLAVFACGDSSCSPASPGEHFVLDTGTVHHPDIAIREDGRPIISYMNPDVMVYLCSNDNCASGSFEQIDGRQFGSLGGFIVDETAVAIDRNGLPVIAYGVSSSGASIYQCNDPSCNDGSRFDIDSTDAFASDVDLAVAPTGERLVSHFRRPGGGLRLFQCAPEGCDFSLTSGRTYVNVDLAGDTLGVQTSIAVRPNGRPIISFIDRLRDRLMVYSCGEATCGN